MWFPKSRWRNFPSFLVLCGFHIMLLCGHLCCADQNPLWHNQIHFRQTGGLYNHLVWIHFRFFCLASFIIWSENQVLWLLLSDKILKWFLKNLLFRSKHQVSLNSVWYQALWCSKIWLCNANLKKWGYSFYRNNLIFRWTYFEFFRIFVTLHNVNSFA